MQSSDNQESRQINNYHMSGEFSASVNFLLNKMAKVGQVPFEQQVVGNPIRQK